MFDTTLVNPDFFLMKNANESGKISSSKDFNSDTE